PYALALAISPDADAASGGFGRVHGTLRSSLEGCSELAIAFGETAANAAARAAAALGTSFEQHAERRSRVDARSIAVAHPPLIDETGSVLFAYEAAWQQLGDERLDEALWPSARRAADYLLTTLDAHGIPCRTADLWEERDGCHAYTAAAVAAGLDAAASFARRHEPDAEPTYASAAERLRDALDRCFWSDDDG